MILRGRRCRQARQRLAVVPGHPRRRALFQLLGVPQKLREVIECIDVVEFAGVDQAHEQITAGYGTRLVYFRVPGVGCRGRVWVVRQAFCEGPRAEIGWVPSLSTLTKPRLPKISDFDNPKLPKAVGFRLMLWWPYEPLEPVGVLSRSPSCYQPQQPKQRPL